MEYWLATTRNQRGDYFQLLLSYSLLEYAKKYPEEVIVFAHQITKELYEEYEDYVG